MFKLWKINFKLDTVSSTLLKKHLMFKMVCLNNPMHPTIYLISLNLYMTQADKFKIFFLQRVDWDKEIDVQTGRTDVVNIYIYSLKGIVKWDFFFS